MLHVGVCSWIRIASDGKAWVSAVTVLAECSAVSLQPLSWFWWLLIRDYWVFVLGLQEAKCYVNNCCLIALNCTVPVLCQLGAPNSCCKSLWIVWGSVENQLKCLRSDSCHILSLWLLSAMCHCQLGVVLKKKLLLLLLFWHICALGVPWKRTQKCLLGALPKADLIEGKKCCKTSKAEPWRASESSFSCWMLWEKQEYWMDVLY